jgi:hypothetical protein
MPTIKKRTDRQNTDMKLIEGMKKHTATLPPLIIRGQTYTPPQIVVVLQKRVDTGDAVFPAKAVYRAAVKADVDERAATDPFVSDLVQALHIAYATSIDTLADFGLSPHKRRKAPTAEEKAKAVEKAKATREARHPSGAKPGVVAQTPPNGGAPPAHG